MKKLLLILFTLSCFFAEGQILQKDNTFGREMNRLAIDTLFGLPKDTFLVPASLQNIPFMANKAGSIYTWNISTLVWNLFSPGETTTASQGITKVGSDFQLGGTITSDRLITINNGSFRLNTSNTASADYMFLATDTVSNPDLDANIPFAGFLNKRTLQFPSHSTTTYRAGAQFNLNVQIKDSATLNTIGGDFSPANKTTMVLEKMSGYSGRSVYMGGTAATLSEGVPIQLNDLTLQHSTSTISNYRYAKNWWVGTRSYLVIGQNDTLQNWVGFHNMGFNQGGKVDYAFDFVGGHFGDQSVAKVTNPWFLFGHSTRSKSLIAGPTGFGDSTIEASALIDASSTTKGVIWPRMTTVQKNAIASPATGLIVFDTDLVQYNFWDGDSWEAMGGGGGGANTALSNLASVAINTSLLPGSNNSIGIGNTSLAYNNIYGYNHIFKGATSGEINLVAAAVAGTNTITFPAATGTVGILGSTQTWTGANTFSSTLIATSNLLTNTASTNSNFSATGGEGISGVISASAFQLEGSTNNISRIRSVSTSNQVLSNNVSYASIILAQTPITESGSGNHPLISGMALRAPSITGGVATVSNTATLYIDAAPSATVTGANYALWVKSGDVAFTNGNLTLGTAGNKLNITTGSNSSIGVSAAMTAGTITISTTAVTASSKIFLTHASLGGTQGILSVGTITAGTSFVINSSNAADTGTVNWWIVN